MMVAASSADAASMPGVGGILAAQLAAFLALLLAATAAHKWLRRQRALEAAQTFAGLPRSAAPAAILAMGSAEWAAAVLLLLPSFRVVGALLAASILTVYLALIARSLIAGRRDVDCGCSFGTAPHPLGTFDAVRNAVLAAMALFVAASAVRGGAAIAASQMLGAAALLALYGALEQVMSLQPMRKGAAL
jgi:hypothetical protein